MGEVINLNKARKTRARADAQAKAVENRAKFGRTRAQKAAESAERDRIARMIDDSKRD
jgi:hypothetical protein